MVRGGKRRRLNKTAVPSWAEIGYTFASGRSKREVRHASAFARAGGSHVRVFAAHRAARGRRAEVGGQSGLPGDGSRRGNRDVAQVEDPDQRAVAITAIAETQSRLGQATEAMATARRIAGVPNCVKAGSLAGVGAAARRGLPRSGPPTLCGGRQARRHGRQSRSTEYVSAVIIGEQIKARYFAEASALAHRLGAKRQIIAPSGSPSRKAGRERSRKPAARWTR